MKIVSSFQKLSKRVSSFLLVAAILFVSSAVLTDAVAATPKNIALKAAVFAETGDTYLDNGYGPARMHDSKNTTFFSGVEGSSPDRVAEVYMVFDGTYTLSSIELLPRTNGGACGIPTDFTITAYDGSKWEEIVNVTGNTANGTTYKKTGLDKAYTAVCLRATKLSKVVASTKYALQLAEFRVMGVKADTKLAAPVILQDTMNVAPQAQVLFDVEKASWNTDFTIDKLNDGVKNSHKNFAITPISKNANTEKEIYLTFDEVYQINQVSLFPAEQIIGGTLKYVGGFPVDFTISVWDGIRWKEVAREKDLSLGAYETPATDVQGKTYTFSPVEAKAVRINVSRLSPVNAAGTQFSLRLAEIEVNGVQSATTGVESPNVVFQAANVAAGAQMSVAADHKSVEYVFDKSYKVHEVTLAPATPANFPSQFEVLVWNGSAWQQVKSFNSADFASGSFSVSFEPVLTRGIKLVSDADVPALDAANREIVIRGVGTATVVKPVEPTVNAALDATITMETPSWASTMRSDKLVDGKLGTFATTEFAADAATVKTVEFSFKNSYTVKTLNLYPRISGTVARSKGGFPKAFKVSVWNGTAWQVVTEVTAETVFSGDYPKLSLDLGTATLCNTLRIETTALGDSDNANLPFVLQLAEVEVLGEKSDTTLPRPAAPQEPGVNAALNGTVEMEVSKYVGDKFCAENMVDGNTTGTNSFATGNYFADPTTQQDVVIAFKDNGAFTIDRVKLYPRMYQGGIVSGFPEDFKISVWDGTKWVQVAEKTGVKPTTKDPVTVSFEPVVCNGIKLEVTRLGHVDNGKNYGLQLTEFMAMGEESTATLGEVPLSQTKPPVVVPPQEPEVTGTNAALNGTVEMEISKYVGDKFRAENMVDGNTTGTNSFVTGNYFADPATKQDVVIAFKDGTFTIDRIMLYPRMYQSSVVSGFPEDFKISVWNGTKWVQVATKAGVKPTTKNPVTVSFTPVVCNGIKIEVTRLGHVDNGKSYGLQLTEVMALGEKSSEKMADVPLKAIKPPASTTVTIDNDKNLALNRPVKASSDLADYNAPVSKVNDGSLGSYWASDDRKYVKDEPQWVEINLLDNYKVHTVILGARQLALGFPIDFSIEVFYNGEWKTVKTVKDFAANEKAAVTAYQFEVTPTIGNKVRVSSANFRKVGTANSMVLAEVAVYGDVVNGDYALPNENMITTGVLVTATSSMEDYDYYVTNLTDGSFISGFSTVPSTENTTQSVEFDMKGTVRLSELQIKPAWGGSGFPVDFTISGFSNGKWVQLYQATDYPLPEDEAIQRFQFATTRVSKFRITVTKMRQEAGLYIWKMNEIMAYPSHTGAEFDPDRVAEITSVTMPESAQTITDTLRPASDSSTDTKIDTVRTVSVWKIVVGSIVVLASIAGYVFLMLSNRKKKASTESTDKSIP